MLSYILIGLCFSLVGVAGLQLMYMFYLDRLDRERKKRLAELERRVRELKKLLAAARHRIDEQDELIESLELFGHGREEAWADVIEEN
ncbi:MAG: hypothetical protein AB7Q37_09685 [Pyrinomonadaceae bacterium]